MFFLATVDFKKKSLVTGKKIFTQVMRLFLNFPAFLYMFSSEAAVEDLYAIKSNY